MLEKAVALAVKAHAGQRDKSGEPYVFHPLRMMLRCQSFEEKLVSVLHDVIEDSDYTIKELRKEGCPEDVLIAIEHLSRKNDESYDEFIDRALTPLRPVSSCRSSLAYSVREETISFIRRSKSFLCILS